MQRCLIFLRRSRTRKEQAGGDTSRHPHRRNRHEIPPHREQGGNLRRARERSQFSVAAMLFVSAELKLIADKGP